MTVDGSGSTVNASGKAFTIGNAGNGTLIVSNGGVLENPSTFNVGLGAPASGRST